MDANSQEFLKEIIGMYDELPCLWKVKSKDYSNKIAKNKAYDKLVEKFKEVKTSLNASKNNAIFARSSESRSDIVTIREL